MYQLILMVHVFVAVCVIALVLVQQGKGATVGAAFGSGASQTVFGSRGSGSFLFRLTASLIAVFFITSMTLNYLVTVQYKQQNVMALPAIPTKAAETPAPASTTAPMEAPTKVPANIDLPVTSAPAPTLPEIPKRN